MPHVHRRAVALALITLGTITLAGFTHAALFDFVRSGGRQPLWSWGNLGSALWFTLGLGGPMAAHELGHILVYRHYAMRYRGPFALPAPFLLTGTVGAFIRLESPYPSRHAMIVNGASGPILGLLAALPAAILGMRWSIPVSALVNGTNLKRLGMPWVMSWLGGGKSYVLHPLSAGAYVALILTFVNLLPMEHFDGGTILNALHRPTARIVSVLMLGVSFFLASYAVTWAAILGAQILVLMVAGWQSEPTAREPLTPVAWLVVGAAVVAFALTWTRL